MCLQCTTTAIRFRPTMNAHLTSTSSKRTAERYACLTYTCLFDLHLSDLDLFDLHLALSAGEEQSQTFLSVQSDGVGGVFGGFGSLLWLRQRTALHPHQTEPGMTSDPHVKPLHSSVTAKSFQSVGFRKRPIKRDLKPSNDILTSCSSTCCR